MILERIEEHHVEGKRLGRHIEHDPKSKEYPYDVERAVPLKSVIHRRYGGPFDQGQLGSCTGNAIAGSCNTIPLHRRGEKLLVEQDAIDIYSKATVIDGFPGEYPPDDTGSSGTAVAKVAKSLGLIGSYHWAFRVETALQALMHQDFIIGINWYEGFDNPDEHGRVQIAGQIRGGHEVQIRGLQLHTDPATSLLIAENSWGTSYGLNGIFLFTVDTLQRLMDQQGDMTILYPVAA
jgi:hypothetical protein